MKIGAITTVNAQRTAFCANIQNNGKNNPADLKTPMQKAADTAALWFGFGVGLDLLGRKIKPFRSPLKNSVAINGVISSVAATATGINAVKQSEGKQISV